MPLSDRTMLRFHVEAVWDVKLPSLDQAEVTLLPGSALPDWRLYVAELAEGRVIIWRAGLAGAEREELLACLGRSSPGDTSRMPGVSREVALRLAATPAIDLAMARRIARQVTPADYELIEAFRPGEAAQLLQPGPRPLLGVVVAGSLLSLAHSSRRTAQACELGIDTLPEARRRGYALAATVAWSAAVSAEGLTPIYSAFAENAASRRLAAAAGYREFARAVKIE